MEVHPWNKIWGFATYKSAWKKSRISVALSILHVFERDLWNQIIIGRYKERKGVNGGREHLCMSWPCVELPGKLINVVFKKSGILSVKETWGKHGSKELCLYYYSNKKLVRQTVCKQSRSYSTIILLKLQYLRTLTIYGMTWSNRWHSYTWKPWFYKWSL